MTKSAKLGQNFLRDEGIALRIVDLLEAANGAILEIGAGPGILSERLMERFPGRPLTLVEIDTFLAMDLEKRFAGPIDPRRGDRVEVISGDILQVDLAEMFPDGRVTVIGNLPYHISKPLIDWLIYQRERIAEAVLMLQRDFVDKLLAPHGGKKYNAQSVVFQLLFQSRQCFHVPAGAFAPKPKVVSTVIAARPLAPPLPDIDKFYAFIKLCFAERRKTLWNNLAPHYEEIALASAFAAAAIATRSRAEQLPALRFLALRDELAKSGKEPGQ